MRKICFLVACVLCLSIAAVSLAEMELLGVSCGMLLEEAADTLEKVTGVSFTEKVDGSGMAFQHTSDEPVRVLGVDFRTRVSSQDIFGDAIPGRVMEMDLHAALLGEEDENREKVNGVLSSLLDKYGEPAYSYMSTLIGDGFLRFDIPVTDNCVDFDAVPREGTTTIKYSWGKVDASVSILDGPKGGARTYGLSIRMADIIRETADSFVSLGSYEEYMNQQAVGLTGF